MGKIKVKIFSNSEVPKYLRNIHIPTEQAEAVRFTT
jgi:hypothetical protein